MENQGVYWVYEYEGPLSDMENVNVLLSWKSEYTASSKPEVCLLCTDQSLDLVTIQRYYHERWNIETGYRYFKELLGFDQYQLLSFVGIQRFWAIPFLTYNFLELQRYEWSQKGHVLTLGDCGTTNQARVFRTNHCLSASTREKNFTWNLERPETDRLNFTI